MANATQAPATTTTTVRVIGARRHPFRDAYHGFLRMPWSAALGLIVATYLVVNAIFAIAYMLSGGVSGVRPGDFADAFFFSAQTLGTIGYGAMYPTSAVANALMVAESVCGLLITALATGLVFAKFSRTTPRIQFARSAVVGPWNGKPTLMLRAGNERGNQIVEALVRVSMVRTEHTAEGVTFYKMVDVPLVRERSPFFTRSWNMMHVIDEKSPLFGKTPQALVDEEVELIVSLVGTDDTSLQPIHARHSYDAKDIVWGARHADVLSEEPDGTMTLDLRKFHDVEPTRPMDGFPYPQPASST